MTQNQILKQNITTVWACFSREKMFSKPYNVKNQTTKKKPQRNFQEFKFWSSSRKSQPFSLFLQTSQNFPKKKTFKKISIFYQIPHVQSDKHLKFKRSPPPPSLSLVIFPLCPLTLHEHKFEKHKMFVNQRKRVKEREKERENINKL